MLYKCLPKNVSIKASQSASSYIAVPPSEEARQSYMDRSQFGGKVRSYSIDSGSTMLASLVD